MKIQINKKRKSGFTLIEMIGVLAVIAILAALLIPKIFEAINNARINNACISINTIKTALADHYAKYGTLASANGAPIAIGATSQNFDAIALLAEGFIDKPFEVKIALPANADVQLVNALAAATAPTGVNANYDLDGVAATVEVSGTSTVVAEVVMTGVAAADALELSKRLDGDAMSEADVNALNDIRGRVKYTLAAAGGAAEVHVYLTHR